jgi:hypothetical protein
MPAEQVPFSKIRRGQRFTYNNTSFTKINKTQGEDHGGVKVTVAPDTIVLKPPKRMSKVEQWNDACSRARTALDAARDAEPEGMDADELPEAYTKAKTDLVDALNELNEMAQEYGETYDNQPEQLQSSPYGEKLSAMQDLDLEASEENDLEELEGKLDEAEGAEVPLGFGRD